ASSTEPGNAGAAGVRPSITCGDSSIPVRTCGVPTSARSRPRSAGCLGATSPRLEALGQALFVDGVRPVGHGPDLDAGLLGGEDLPGIAESPRIEGGLEASHQVEVSHREDERHEVGLLQADAVLAGDRAADLGTDAHDLGP